MLCLTKESVNTATLVHAPVCVRVCVCRAEVWVIRVRLKYQVEAGPDWIPSRSGSGGFEKPWAIMFQLCKSTPTEVSWQNKISKNFVCFYQWFPLHTVYTRSCLSWYQTWNWPIYLLFFFSQLLPFHYSLSQTDTQRMQDGVVYCTSRVARKISTLVLMCVWVSHTKINSDWIFSIRLSLTFSSRFY